MFCELADVPSIGGKISINRIPECFTAYSNHFKELFANLKKVQKEENVGNAFFYLKKNVKIIEIYWNS